MVDLLGNHIGIILQIGEGRECCKITIAIFNNQLLLFVANFPSLQHIIWYLYTLYSEHSVYGLTTVVSSSASPVTTTGVAQVTCFNSVVGSPTFRHFRLLISSSWWWDISAMFGNNTCSSLRFLASTCTGIQVCISRITSSFQLDAPAPQVNKSSIIIPNRIR